MPHSPTGYDDPRHTLLDVLSCPHCGDRFRHEDGTLRCGAGHSFDIARHGYVGLLTGNAHAGSGDAASMVQARVAFLRAGHYAPLSATLARLAAAHCGGCRVVLDAGTGTGYYLAELLDALPGAVGLGLDTSKHALRRAGSAHPRAGAASWDVWRPLPVATRSVDLVLNVFAPRNAPEFHRVLRPHGALLVATPSPRHLAELRTAVGTLAVDEAKEERLRHALSGYFLRERTEEREYAVRLPADDLSRLVSMGPTARHLGPDELDRRIALLDGPLDVTVSFVVSVYRKIAP
ncbi:putative RNA methyltransferase [Streptomyces tsukubensis]|uniref:Methyltransferase type 11 n=1 Tax=Streptomyces tsukubensis TaxID=83656 RepID=A0A1V4A4T3_9ACTN|nr:methyltransferase domain-containing protein [Streptomyces tsukubensis]OON75990.1 methyltransferase type 11 [Streptomyces tsukubensis]QFR94080.1 methyltransferase domain-containing protein [Streptomyces tsukubensis]